LSITVKKRGDFRPLKPLICYKARNKNAITKIFLAT
jgi:hypothetical protein